MPHRDNEARNVSINRFHFIEAADVPSSGDLDQIEAALFTFYTVDTSTTTAVQDYLGESIDGPDCGVLIYNLLNPPGSPPIREGSLPLTILETQTPMDRRVTVNLWFQAPTAPIPVRSKTNHIKVGPLNEGAGLDDGDGDLRPHPTFITTLNLAADRLKDDNATQWATYSEKLDFAATVTQGWVDNLFGTVRSRRVRATERETFV